ncbi:MAG: cytochrome c oxidase subunit 3, partial [Candidatus Acidiferrum sp.]
VLGVLFLIGQLVAWRQLVDAGFYLASNQASSFFYIFTGLHGLHLLGGICALLFVSFRKFERASVSRAVAAEIVSYYWHFMDGLWIFLFALLYFGK